MGLLHVDVEEKLPGRSLTTEGTKHDKDKPRWDLLPWRAIGVVVDILGFGAVKYGDRNWEQGLSFGRTWAALQRHGTAWWGGEDNDPETGYSHIAHLATNALFLLTFILQGRKDLDDRPAHGT